MTNSKYCWCGGSTEILKGKTRDTWFCKDCGAIVSVEDVIPIRS